MAFRSNEEWLQALLKQSGGAQAEALQELRDFLLRAVLTYLSRRSADLPGWNRQTIRDLAEDLAQEALIEVRENLHTFRVESKFTTWAYRFVINRAASELRRQHYRNLSLDQLREDELVALQTLLFDPNAGPGLEPERLAERRSYMNLLRAIVETELNERQRAAIVWVLWEGRSMGEVAKALGITRNALYKLLHDARKRIKARLLARHLSLGDILAAFED
jgi:RNA polymerase sigma-70 factor (ECF subfamily)